MALSKVIHQKFKNAFTQKCFKLLVQAFQSSLSENVIQLNWNENDISSEILRHIKVNPTRTKWKISANVEAHIPNNDQKVKGFADKFPRIDFRLTTFTNYNEYEYFFEAKILRQSITHLKRRYITTGIDNFVSKKYENGSLIGYLLEGKPNETINGINSLLVKDNRKTEILILKSRKSLTTHFESNHNSIGILKHLIFDFTSISN